MIRLASTTRSSREPKNQAACVSLPANGRWGCGSENGLTEDGLLDAWGEDSWGDGWGSKDGLRMIGYGW